MPEWNRPYHIVCEGDGDESFITRLIEHHGLPPIDVSNPRGTGGYKDHLRALRVLVDRGVITRIAVIADNDDDPRGSFVRVKKAFRDARGIPIPRAPQTVRTGTVVSSAIFMMPTADTPGSMETLLLASARKVRPDLTPCVEAFAACAGLGDWSQTALDKMMLRAFIACALKEDPNCTLRWIWGKSEKPLDIADESFSPLVEWLKEFFV